MEAFFAWKHSEVHPDPATTPLSHAA